MEKWMELNPPDSHWLYSIPYTAFLILIESAIAWVLNDKGVWWELLHIILILGFTSLLHFTIAPLLFKPIKLRLNRESISEHYVLYFLAAMMFQAINFYYPISIITADVEIGLVFCSIPLLYLLAVIPFLEKRDNLYIHILSMIIAYRFFALLYFLSYYSYFYLQWDLILILVIVGYIIGATILIKTKAY